MNKTKFILLVVWLLTCIGVLLSFLYHPRAFDDPEVTILFHLRMLIITFPIGYLVYVILTAIPAPDSVFISQEVLLIVFWATFLLTGYLQWFVIIPRVFGWLKTKTMNKGNKAE